MHAIDRLGAVSPGMWLTVHCLPALLRSGLVHISRARPGNPGHRPGLPQRTRASHHASQAGATRYPECQRTVKGSLMVLPGYGDLDLAPGGRPQSVSEWDGWRRTTISTFVWARRRARLRRQRCPARLACGPCGRITRIDPSYIYSSWPTSTRLLSNDRAHSRTLSD